MYILSSVYYNRYCTKYQGTKAKWNIAQIAYDYNTQCTGICVHVDGCIHVVCNTEH